LTSSLAAPLTLIDFRHPTCTAAAQQRHLIQSLLLLLLLLGSHCLSLLRLLLFCRSMHTV
jgi:hypothetical protein